MGYCPLGNSVVCSRCVGPHFENVMDFWLYFFSFTFLSFNLPHSQPFLLLLALSPPRFLFLLCIRNQLAKLSPPPFGVIVLSTAKIAADPVRLGSSQVNTSNHRFEFDTRNDVFTAMITLPSRFWRSSFHIRDTLGKMVLRRTTGPHHYLKFWVFGGLCNSLRAQKANKYRPDPGCVCTNSTDHTPWVKTVTILAFIIGQLLNF